MKNKKILLIIPAYNEEASIINTVNSIINYKELDLDYIVINDGSTDKTEKLLIDNNISHIKLPFNMGIGAAVQTGYKYARDKNYDIAVQFDGDGQHDINYIKKLIMPIINDNANMTIGSRYIDDISEFKSTKTRQFGIKLLSKYIKLLSKREIKDVTSGYRAADKSIIKIFSKEYPTEYPEPITNYVLLKLNYKVIEIGVNMLERKGGKSSINLTKSVYYMFNTFISIILINLKKYKEESDDIF